ncbi:hypothetical protein PE066_12885 [Ramlibacter tataouinensis]|uniref:hypothetical protein n=1 Tax=Ramlibacter tataouinensis TaxID=94132 RepID=UPI0022F402DC|nr:hypothetical protein [Ramlibacter tataouinensis]WBY00368.1 hypothetical protein PE066_12885 [Ramlibacter tataouinensis]
MSKTTLTAALAAAAALGLAACDVQKTDEGHVALPKYEVTKTQEGRVDLPNYNVKTPDVEVGTTRKQVTVPDVDVHAEKKTIEVPKVTVTPPAEERQANATGKQ